MGTNVTPG